MNPYYVDDSVTLYHGDALEVLRQLPDTSVDAVIAEILGRDRAIPALRKDIAAMRAEMAEHKPPKGPLDVKLCPGGLVDAEFCIHALQLEHRKGIHPQLKRAVGELRSSLQLLVGYASKEGGSTASAADRLRAMIPAQ